MIFSRPDTCEGALVLTEVRLPKQGHATVGCDRYNWGLVDRRSETPRYANGQCLLVWCWVTTNHAWPVAAQLFLPSRWTLKSARIRKTQIPPRFSRYKTKTEMALELLDELQLQLNHRCPLLLDDVLADEWELFAELSRRQESYVARLDLSGLWPVNSPIIARNIPREQWNPLDKYFHHSSNYHWFGQALKASKQSLLRNSVQKIPAITSDYWHPLLGFERYLFWHGRLEGMAGIYLLDKLTWSRRELIALTNRLRMARDVCKLLTDSGGLRRFEGRKWRGVHHHMALCFMAHHFTHR